MHGTTSAPQKRHAGLKRAFSRSQRGQRSNKTASYAQLE